jgi:hypothetical protein
LDGDAWQRDTKVDFDFGDNFSIDDHYVLIKNIEDSDTQRVQLSIWLSTMLKSQNAARSYIPLSPFDWKNKLVTAQQQQQQ